MNSLLDLPEDTLLAVDTEFHAERHYTPMLYLIQVCAPGGEPLIIDPLDRDQLATLGPKLRKHPWLVHAGSTDLVLLERALGGIPDIVLDTQIAAGITTTRYPAGLAYLTKTVLGVPLDKGQALSDWSRRPLTAEQCAYAGGDVVHLHALWDALSSPRPEMVAAACAEARDQALKGTDPDRAWRRIPGRHSLDPAGAGVLCALAAWRERTARETDTPPYSLLNNGTLLQLAKRRPDDLDALLKGRRSPTKALRRNADPLLEAIGRGAQSSRPVLTPGSQERAAHTWLQAWAAHHGQQGSWATRLVAPDDLLEDWIHGTPLRGWRAQMLPAQLEPIPMPAAPQLLDR